MSALLIPLAAIALPAVIVPMSIAGKHLARQRQYRHEERMQALKAGLHPSAGVQVPGPGAVVAIGAGVPVAAVLGALGATLSLPFHTPDLVPLLAIIWSASVLLGICGLATGLILGLMLHRASRRRAAAPSGKAAYDPDLFDPVHSGY